jgi:RNA polymerase-binding transcription factor DksA
MKTAHFAKKLEEEKLRLEAGMQGVGRKNPAVPGDWENAPTEANTESDPVDRADVITMRDTDAAVLDALEARYDSTIAALHRIENGTYGTCEVCGQPIVEARLEANPAATTCTAHMR